MSHVNILHLLADQFRGDMISALGNHIVHTPNLDRLCQEGVAFKNAFTPSPVCVPARASMVFGRYPVQTGCYDNDPDKYRPAQRDEESFMAQLGAAGYRTHGIGKCHFTPNLYARRGFETRETSEEIVPDPAMDDYTSWLHQEGYGHIAEPHGIRSEMYYIPQVAQMPASHHPTQWVGDRAVAFLKDRRAEDEPWYLFTSFIHPHPPFSPPAPWHKLYRAFDMPLPHLPLGYETLQLYFNKVQNRYKYRDRGSDLNLIRCLRAAYYACVSFIDYQVGRILLVLEETGQMENTLIVFTADHGELLGDYGCFGKRSMVDPAARVPLIARYPAWFRAGTRCEEVVSLVDLAPTFLEAAQRKGAQDLPGVSLLKTYAGESSREFVFAQFEIGDKALYMAVSQQWKYVYSAADQRELVFDRAHDPMEAHNVAALPGYEAVTSSLRQTLQQFLEEHGEHSNLDSTTDTHWQKRVPLTMPQDPDEGLIVQDPDWADFTIPGYSTAPHTSKVENLQKFKSPFA